MYAKTLIPGPLPTPTLTATTSVAHQLFPELLASGWKRYGVEDLAVSRTDVLITHDSLQLVVDGIVVLSDIDPASPAGWWEAVDGIDGQCVVVVLKTGDIDLHDPQLGARQRELMAKPDAGVWTIARVGHPAVPHPGTPHQPSPH